MTRPKPPSKKGSPDDFQTPPEALDPLIPFIKREWTIWEPAQGKGNLVRRLGFLGFSIFGTDIKTGQDFLKDLPDHDFNMILTKPPYSLKDKFLKRCYYLGAPFALLLPLTAFEGQVRQKLFGYHGVEVILFPRRLNFQTPSGDGSGSWFMTAWFTHGLNIGRELTFPDYGKELDGW